MEQGTGSVIKVRPAQLELAQPSFQPQVVSSAANIFQQEVLAQSYDKNRIAWQWRSPSANLLCSPLIYGVMRLKLTCPYKLTKGQQIGPLLGVYDTGITVADTENVRNIVLNQSARGGYGFRPMFAFSAGNAVMNACESKSISVNGGTWTALNENLYLRSLDECYVPRAAAQRAWSTCGGCKNANNSVPNSGIVLGLPDSISLSARNAGGAAADNSLVTVRGADNNAVIHAGFCPTEGATMDSGLVRRMENFYDQIIATSIPDFDSFGGGGGARAAGGRTYTLEIKFPISGSVFNDLWGAQALARSDPRLRMALGLPHINQCQIILSFKSLFKTLIRRLGRPHAVGDAGNTNRLVGAVSALDEDVRIEFDTTYPPRLRATYIRLPSFRSYPQTSVLQIYRREIRRPSGTRVKGDFGTKAFNAALWGASGSENGLRCSGDVFSVPSHRVVRPMPRDTDVSHYKEVTWTGVQFPQPPSYIFITYQKDPSFTNYNAPLSKLDTVAPPGGADYSTKFDVTAARGTMDTAARLNALVGTAFVGAYDQASCFAQELAARNIAMAQDSNASITAVEIVIQSAVGSFAFRDSGEHYLQDRDRLWNVHVRNCHANYCEAGRGVWADKESCLLLSSSDYLIGLSTSPGTVFPITLDVKVRFANRATYSGGACFSLGQGVKGKCQFEQIIIGEPTLVGCFHQNVMSIAASSSVLSSQAFSQATTAAALQSS